MTGLRGALSFLTRIPMGSGPGIEPSRAVPWFPLAGALIGLAIGGVYAGAWHALPPLATAAVAVALGALVTGAFHQDGLADMADAFGGGWTVEQRLAILKDPRHGTYGVTALAMVLVLQVTALGSLSPWWGFAALVAAHTLGRVTILGCLLWARPASPRGLGTDYVDDLPRARVVVGAAFGMVVAIAAMGPWAVVAVGVGVLGAFGVQLLAHRKIGGFTGDVLGATEQVVETLVLLVAAGAAHRGGTPW